MKVYIGPYKNHINSYYIAKKILFWKDEYTDEIVIKFGDFLEKIPLLDKICKFINSKKTRKIKVRIDNYDTWSMDYTLAPIVLPMLKQLKVTKHGAPHVDIEDGPEKLRDTAQDEYGLDVFYFERWDYILDEMIYAFDCLVNEYDSDFNMSVDDRVALENRISNGFRLFGKYFRSLWD
jgi:hypothetical protein